MDSWQDDLGAWAYTMVPPPWVWALDALLVLALLTGMYAYRRAWRGEWNRWHSLRMFAYAVLLVSFSLGALALFRNQQSVPAYRIPMLVGLAVLLLGDAKQAGEKRNEKRAVSGKKRSWWGW